MRFDIYWAALAVLLPIVVILTARNLLQHLRPLRWRFLPGASRRNRDGKLVPPTESDNAEEGDEVAKGSNVACEQGLQNRCRGSPVDEEAARFRVIFLQVYLLVMGSEWLQGPYTYTLLRDEKALPESTVALLYATVFVAAAASALIAGVLADRFGRRAACFVFCGVHSLSCLSVLSDSVPMLFAGRVLSGVALTLLWTVFESWMVTEYNARGLERSRVSLEDMFGVMTISNCMTAMIGGLSGHCFVLVLGSKTSPFLVGILLEAAAAYLMYRNWNENFGTRKNGGVLSEDDDSTKDKRWHILALSYVACFFEGSNFLVLFVWPSMLQQAHSLGTASPERAEQSDQAEENDIPFGVVFATFMASMILGAMLFKSLSRRRANGVEPERRSPLLSPPTVLLTSSVSLAGLTLIVIPHVRSEPGLFASFLLFELCNGLFVPSIAWHRGVVVDEGNRAGVYGLMKVPQLVFVVSSLGIMGAGDETSRRILLMFSGSCLLFTFPLTVITGGFGIRSWRTYGAPVVAELDDEEAIGKGSEHEA